MMEYWKGGRSVYERAIEFDPEERHNLIASPQVRAGGLLKERV